MRSGILHARAERRGGPYYTFVCPECALPLVAEMSVERPFVVRSASELNGEPALLRVLKNFLAPPKKPAQKPGEKRAKEPRRRFRPIVGFAKSRKPAAGNSQASRLVYPWSLRDRQLLSALALPETIGFEELRKSYRRFVRENHPDRFVRLPESKRIESERRFVEVNSVYRELLVSIDHHDDPPPA